MKIKSMIFVCFSLAFCAAAAFGQNGGKAEPNRIVFARGKSSAAVNGTLSDNVQAEYVFAAKKGQKISLKVTSVPKGNLFAFSVDGADGIELETRYDSYSEYAFNAPATGDYFVAVTKKPTGKTPKAKYTLTLTIENNR